MLFTVRVLHKMQKVYDKIVEAPDLEQAELIGRKKCEESGEFSYINCERLIWADTSLLGGEPQTAAKKGRVGA